MDVGLRNEIKRCIADGRKDEERVSELLVSCCGGECYSSSLYEDTHKHVDLWWKSPKGGLLGIDVKGMRKNSRKDSVKDGSIQWIEVKNVQGRQGWIYGDMDYIAFVVSDCVLFVKPSALYGKILLNVVGKGLSHVLPSDFYVPYQRKGRGDVIVKVPVSDLHEICHFKISYVD